MHTVDTLAADKGDPWAHYAFESLVEAAGPGSQSLGVRGLGVFGLVLDGCSENVRKRSHVDL